MPRRSLRLKLRKAVTYTDANTDCDESDWDHSSDANDDESAVSNYSPSDTDESQDTQLYCVCNKPSNNRPMICCDQCNIWHHHKCVKLSAAKVKKLSKSKNKWYCPSCKKKRLKKKSKPKPKNKNKNKSKNKKRKRNVCASSNTNNKNNTIASDSPANKRRKTNIIPPIISPQQQAIRNAFSNLSAQTTENPSFELPFAPQATQEQKENESQNTNNTIENEHEHENENQNENENENENEIVNSDSDLEILSNGNNTNMPRNNVNNNMISLAPVIAFLFHENNADVMDTKEMDNDKDDNDKDNNESDDEILIQAGDKWIQSQSFMQNKQLFEKDIMQKKKDNINKCINDVELEEDKDFIVLNNNSKCKQDICPLTLTKIIHPIKNLLCPHIYEREAIQNYKKYLNQNNRELKCPQAGCAKYLYIV